MREIEVKILGIDIDKVVEKLKNIGAKKEGEYLYRRIVFAKPDHKTPFKEWVRLRTDGRRTTLTYKKITDHVEEIETGVGDFETTRKLLKKFGLIEKLYQENRRIRYTFEGIEFDIDFWPKLEPYMEVEAESQDELERGVRLAGFSMKDTVLKTNQELYAEKGIDLNKIKRLTF